MARRVNPPIIKPWHPAGYFYTKDEIDDMNFVSGFSGYSGVKGETGTSGYSGIDAGAEYSGYSGYSGVKGTDGVSGYSGYSGVDGVSGYSGYDAGVGYSGPSGYSGYSGVDGVSGYSGYSGVDGVSGYSGVKGASGVEGAEGASGYSGENGASGYSGYSGLDGIASASGYSGYSGVKGETGTSGYSGTAVAATTSTVNFNNTMTAAEIQALIDAIPKYIPYGVVVTFQFADGTYTPTSNIIWSGFYGKGTIYIYGNTTEADATNLHTTQAVVLDFSGSNTSGIRVRNNEVRVTVSNLAVKTKSDASAYYPIFVYDVASVVYIQYSYFYGSTYSSGHNGNSIYVSYSPDVYLYKNYVSEHLIGIVSTNNAKVLSNNNDDTGTSPVYGLYASFGGVIHKYSSTQPAGSERLEYEGTGGLIWPKVYSTTARTALGDVAEGMIVYDSTLNQIFSYDGSNWYSGSGYSGVSGASGTSGKSGYSGYSGNTYELDVRNYASFAAAITAIDTDEATLFIPTAQTVSVNVTVPSNVQLHFGNGGSLAVDTHRTVTIEGHINAGRYKIFDLTGTAWVDLTDCQTDESYPEWWGADGYDSGVDSGAACQLMVDSGHKKWSFQCDAYYYFATSVTIPTNYPNGETDPETATTRIFSHWSLLGNWCKINIGASLTNAFNVTSINHAAGSPYWNQHFTVDKFCFYGANGSTGQSFIKLNGGNFYYGKITNINGGGYSTYVVHWDNNQSNLTTPDVIEIGHINAYPVTYPIYFVNTGGYGSVGFGGMNIHDIYTGTIYSGSNTQIVRSRFDTIYGNVNTINLTYAWNCEFRNILMESNNDDCVNIGASGNTYEDCRFNQVHNYTYMSGNTGNHILYGKFIRCSFDHITFNILDYSNPTIVAPADFFFLVTDSVYNKVRSFINLNTSAVMDTTKIDDDGSNNTYNYY